jgi:hypothetical protein
MRRLWAFVVEKSTAAEVNEKTDAGRTWGILVNAARGRGARNVRKTAWILAKSGERGRNRTYNLLIKSR